MLRKNHWSIIWNRSSHRRCSIKKLFLKISHYETPTQVFSCEYCEIKNTYFKQTAAFEESFDQYCLILLCVMLKNGETLAVWTPQDFSSRFSNFSTFSMEGSNFKQISKITLTTVNLLQTQLQPRISSFSKYKKAFCMVISKL